MLDEFSAEDRRKTKGTMIVCDDREAGSARRVDSEDYRIKVRMFTVGSATFTDIPLLSLTDLN